jgi:hypothetical protein
MGLAIPGTIMEALAQGGERPAFSTATTEVLARLVMPELPTN